jgi:hypothetical protein
VLSGLGLGARLVTRNEKESTVHCRG